MNELQKISKRISVTKEAVRVLRSARGLIPDKERRDAIDKNIHTAEDTLNRCSARIAKLTEKKK
jgi:Zn-dependent peptidase ImmA (M78 family)